VALATPPASVTAPVLVPLMMAASLLPVMVTVTVCVVPSAVVTVKVSLSVADAAKACTEALARRCSSLYSVAFIFRDSRGFLCSKT
jgi:hypothetical protein